MTALPGSMENVFAGAAAVGPKPVLEFRAGKMHFEGRTVRPDKRKGMLQVWHEDGSLHLKWKDRRTGVTEDDIFLFPGEAVWKKVDKCTTGRVFMLQFVSGGRVMFYWMQEPKDEKDAEYAEKINRYITDPSQALRDKSGGSGGAPAAGGPAAGAGQGAGPGGASQMMQILQQMQQQAQGGGGGGGGGGAGGPAGQAEMQAIMQMLGGGGAPQQGGPAGGGQQGGGGASAQAAALAQALQGAAQQQQQQRSKPDIDLDDLLSQEQVRKLIQDDPAFFEERLKESFPEGIDTSVLQEIRSPQFRQTLGLLQGAAQDPDALKEMVTAFGLPQKFDPKKGGVEQLLNIILHHHQQKAQLALTKVGAEVRTVPPGKAGKYWGTITTVKEDGSVTVNFKEVGEKEFKKQEWEAAPKDFKEPEPAPAPPEDPKDGDGDASMN